MRAMLVSVVVLSTGCFEELDLPPIVFDPQTGDVRIDRDPDATDSEPFFAATSATCSGIWDLSFSAEVVDGDGADDVLAAFVTLETADGVEIDRLRLTRESGSERFSTTTSLFSTDYACDDAMSAVFEARDRDDNTVSEAIDVQAE
jgi:hypothetical protein